MINRTTDVYLKLQKNAQKSAETNDCAVKAIAVVLGCSYDKAHKLCADYGRQNGDGMGVVSIIEALQSVGARIKPLKIPAGKTLSGIVKRLPSERGKFLIITRSMYGEGHISAYKCGQLHDWTSDSQAGKDWNDNSAVTDVFRVSGYGF